MAMEERRLTPRFRLTERCTGRFGNFQRFTVEEIGMGGLKLLSSHPPACGGDCHIYLESANNLQDYLIEILRVNVHDFNNMESDLFRAGPRYSISARFEKMEPAQRTFLVGLLETFFADLPEAPPMENGFAEPVAAPVPVRNQRRAVLIADDDAAIRDVLVEILQMEGFPVLQAQDGVEACELFDLNREAIGLVTLDIDMPRLNGYDAYRRIRSLDPNVRVLFISGAIRFPRQQILDADWLDKPFGTDTFIRYVCGAVGEAGQGQVSRLLSEEVPN
jgi:CheY-like chemotaxis protein